MMYRRATLIALLMLVVTADAAAARGLIAYEALTGGIFTIRPDGSGNRELFSGHEPSWSPDGSRLIFTGTDGALWSGRADGTDLRVVVRPEQVPVEGAGFAYTLTNARWSPSGRRVVFTATGEDPSEAPVSVIATAAVDGTRLRTLGPGSHPEWVTDRRIAFTEGPQMVTNGFWSRIGTMRRDGTRVRWLLNDRKAYRSGLRASRDGRRLAFLERPDRPGFVPAYMRIVAPRSGRSRTVSLNDSLFVSTFAWTPGGRLVYIPPSLALGGRAAPSVVLTIRRSGADRRVLFTLPFEEQRGLWASALDWQPRPR